MKIEREYRTGIERFYHKYPNYPRLQVKNKYEGLGVGAMMIPIDRIINNGLDTKVNKD